MLMADTPTASKVLQRAEERKLWKILRRYSGSGMVEECKFVTNAVVEARFMFHQFQTTQVHFVPCVWDSVE